MFKEKVRARWFWFARWVCRLFCILFFRVRFYGMENVPDKGAFILISNHQSFLDPVLCGIGLKRHLYFLARDSLFKNKLFGGLISSVNTIPVKRGRADFSSIKKIIGKLKDGGGVCLFPEGTRSEDGRIGRFKPGFGLICRRGEAVIVPVLIDGAFECWPKVKKMFSPGSIAVCYGKAIPRQQVEKMDDKELADKLTDRVRQMQNACRMSRGKETYHY